MKPPSAEHLEHWPVVVFSILTDMLILNLSIYLFSRSVAIIVDASKKWTEQD